MIKKLEFQPHPILRGGHLQTLAGFYWPSEIPPYQAEQILVEVSDGDRIALHDDRPEAWAEHNPVVLIIHGLAGCHGSGYVARLAQRLNQRGMRTFRMDMRGTGASAGKAKLPGHAGRTDDAKVAIEAIAERCPQSPLTIVGFSMGGNIALGTLAAASQHPIGNLERGIAVCPPVNLSRCCRELRKGLGNFYDKYLIRHLKERWQATGGSMNGADPKCIYEFDDRITAPLSGFRDAEDYYAHSSSGPRLKEITLPTRILAAMDDPVVAYSAIESAERSEHVELYVTRSGGHLGYVGSKRQSGGGPPCRDRRWMDSLIESWVTAW